MGVVYRRDGLLLTIDGTTVLARGELLADGTLAADLGGVRLTATVIRRGAEITLFYQGGLHRLTLVDPLAAAALDDVPDDRLTAPMPGRIVAVLVAAGAEVVAGQPLLVMEAMKMEHTLKAPAAGTVLSIRGSEGEQVAEGDALIEFEASRD
ncbi:hypothetical protein CCP1ISM_740002 [Azospirillaceae bacterium]